MGTLSVRRDAETEQLLKQLISSRRVTTSDLICEMIEKEAAGELAETINSVSLAVDVLQGRLAEIDNELASLRAVGDDQEQVSSKIIVFATRSAFFRNKNLEGKAGSTGGVKF
ncbi:hypothetical protein KOM00_14760 [Geomonas sp. Red69]|uniref:hypothetical protein n=1 Tax=Geomonas diazotrophica TaxID=2843197 RepID=UPI001C10F77A|nr:hypothetical protein [Geomonas diazotrophica]MBU5637988.1 hypothetical protein [Geomonas diazotrophica]